jgi:hypothetical protein
VGLRVIEKDGLPIVGEIPEGPGAVVFLDLTTPRLLEGMRAYPDPAMTSLSHGSTLPYHLPHPCEKLQLTVEPLALLHVPLC